MMFLLNRVKSGWTMVKFVRVALGGLILYSSIESGQTVGIVLGALFTGLALVADGACCAGGACITDGGQKKSPAEEEEPEYEELVTK